MAATVLLQGQPQLADLWHVDLAQVGGHHPTTFVVGHHYMGNWLN
jgi:hypothetical protein